VISTPKYIIKGSHRLEIILWCLFIIPGIIYSWWRHITKERVCPDCSSMAFIPINSLMGRKFFEELYPDSEAKFVKKRLESQQYGFIIKDHKRHASPSV
jgi:hypothetical protein